jgi:two-component system chemotaxis sensor kinase CheA
MSIDLSEFHDVFFEECFEGLGVMESGLLTLDKCTDVEEINAIFRAAHSIKGGSASFGFMDISSFTHVMETLLDEMRDGRRQVTQPIVDLLLESVDVLRSMVTAAQQNEETNPDRAAEVQQKLEAVLEKSGDDNTSTQSCSDESSSSGDTGPASTRGQSQVWRIKFKPDADMMKNGNDPARIFRELQKLADMSITVDTTTLPAFADLEPESSYLSWVLELHGDVEEKDIRELFSWVEEDSELVITSLDTESSVEENHGTATAEGEPATAEPLLSQQSEAAPLPDAEKQPPQDNRSAATAQAAETPKTAVNKESTSIRVGIDKVDALINMVGELVITQSMLSQISSDLAAGDTHTLEKMLDGITQLERNTRELQESVLQIRMLPISFSFSRFPRLVRDLSNKMGKQIELIMTGENTEVDKTVLEKIGDPLVHLVRNSLDHGIEMPDVRRAAGKPETGTLELRAYHKGGDIIVQVSDDGAGINRDIILKKAIEKGLVNEDEELSDDRINNLIFAPGFSTADQISDVSGRGVGMDVVQRNIRDLGGNVSITSNKGAGSTVTIRLPLTLSILDGQLARIGKETYIVSLVSIVESLQMQPEHISSITGQSELYRLRDEYIPIIRVCELLGMKAEKTSLQDGLLMVVEADGQRVGLFVDDLLGQQQVVIKSLETNFRQIQGISSATILGDGTVALIVDVPGLIQCHFDTCNHRKPALTAVA